MNCLIITWSGLHSGRRAFFALIWCFQHLFFPGYMVLGGWLKCSSEICVIWGLESLLSCRYGFLVNNGKIRLFFWHCGLPYEYLLSTVHLKFFVLALWGYKNLIQELPDRSSHGWFGDAGMLWALLQVLRSPVLPGKQAAPDNKFI